MKKHEKIQNIVGKNASILRQEFKAQKNESPLTKTGNLKKDYEDWLLEKYNESDCKPHWTYALRKFPKKVPDIDAGKIKAKDALAEARKETVLQEKCNLGIGTDLNSFRSVKNAFR
ncbi:MAG: hypothetical protein P8Y97_17580 [Candidatus Lokiarchaeota archaeon]